MYRSILLILCISISLLVASMSHAESPCPPDRSYIILSTAPRGYTCLPQIQLDSIRENIQLYKDHLNVGDLSIKDIISQLENMLAGIRQGYDQAQGTSERMSYMDQLDYSKIILDRMSTYARGMCRNSPAPEITIPTGSSIYVGDTLTPTCSVGGTGTTRIDFSLSAIGPDGKKITYTGSGGTFSGIIVTRHGVGTHTITCSYTPIACTSKKTTTKKVTENTPLPVEQKKPEKTLAREWNEIILDAIRKDRVRPPIESRNLFHWSAMIYDIWVLYHPGNTPYLFDNTSAGVCVKSHAVIDMSHWESDMEQAMSYASYRIILERYRESPGYQDTITEANTLMNHLGYDIHDTGANISKRVTPSALGNAVADCYIRYGLSDGSNESGSGSIAGEIGSYANQYYTPINPPLPVFSTGGNTSLVDWNRWQPLSVDVFIDQAGNQVPGGAATFIGAEWGNVRPFSLRPDQETIHNHDGHDYIAYLDPGTPPLATGATLDLYRWNYELVALWSSHLDPRDHKMIDISPAALGNAAPLPTSFEKMKDFYNTLEGGEQSLGHAINPRTGKMYASQIVPRGDYARVISEFWADGPTSETPPGHWFTILNAVSDKLTSKKWHGAGATLDPLEWDIKSYFALGGALHDAGIAAWSIKGAYDSIRPISAIRAMATAGQSSDPSLPHYSTMGLTLIPGYVELVGTGDVLEGKNGVNINKIKVRAWKGSKYVNDPATDMAGVDWILGENWLPYQRASFVTPPFAGYVSGHSTFSRAAAETLTEITGDPYFPGGIMEWSTRAHNYLVFEQGPSTDITLQWATYRDAANESALSRIWGGIHPPMDDIPGRIIGEKIGKQAFGYATSFFGK